MDLLFLLTCLLVIQDSVQMWFRRHRVIIIKHLLLFCYTQTLTHTCKHTPVHHRARPSTSSCDACLRSLLQSVRTPPCRQMVMFWPLWLQIRPAKRHVGPLILLSLPLDVSHRYENALIWQKRILIVPILSVVTACWWTIWTWICGFPLWW